MEYNFTLPYEATVQRDGLTYPVHVWRDAAAGLMRTDTYGGVNSLYVLKVQLTPTLLRRFAEVLKGGVQFTFRLSCLGAKLHVLTSPHLSVSSLPLHAYCVR